MASRFATVSKDEIVAVKEAAAPANTKKETKFDLSVEKRYQSSFCSPPFPVRNFSRKILEFPANSRESFPGIPGKLFRIILHQHSWEFSRILEIILEQKRAKKFSRIPENKIDFGNSRQFPGTGTLTSSREFSEMSVIKLWRMQGLNWTFTLCKRKFKFDIEQNKINGDPISYLFYWRRDCHFTWSSESREGLPVCRTKAVPEYWSGPGNRTRPPALQSSALPTEPTLQGNF